MTFQRSNIGMRGERVIVNVGNPAAGAEVSYTLPANYEYVPVSVTLRLVNGGAAANRGLTLFCSTGGGSIICRSKQMPNLTAGLSGRVSFFHTATMPTVFDPYNAVPMPFHRDLILTGGDIIGTLTLNIQAADQFSEIVILLQRFAI